MADVQQAPIAAPRPTEITLSTASGPSVPAESASPSGSMTSPTGVTMVTSGTRPLLFGSSSPVVDGAVEPTPASVQSTPISIKPAAAATGIQINTAPSSGIVIRAASSSSSPASATSGDVATVNIVGQTPVPQPISVQVSPASGSERVSSGITIRSSASPTQAATTAPLLTGNQPGQVTISGQSTVSPPVPVQPIQNNNQLSQQQQQVPAVPAPAQSVPAQSASVEVPAKSPPPAGFVSQQQNDVTNPQPPAAASTSVAVNHQDDVIRPPTAVVSGQKSAAAARQEEPPMTLTELVSKLDLITVCGFALAVLSVAFASILTGQDLSIGWLMIIVAMASLGVFIRYRL